MIQLAWPFVALCFCAVLWRALELRIAEARLKAGSWANRGDVAKLEHEVKGHGERLQALEDEVRNLGQRVPSARLAGR